MLVVISQIFISVSRRYFPPNSHSFLPMSKFSLIFLAILSLGLNSYSAAVTISLDFESQFAFSSTVPSGWGFLDTGRGTSGNYFATADGGGVASDGTSIDTGLAGVITAGPNTHGGRLPVSMLVNSGSALGFDVNQNITGSYDFKYTPSSAYDSSAFLFGDLKSGAISGSSAGQLLEFYHSRGGYGNAPPSFIDGAANSLQSGGSNFNSNNTWYRVGFTWTATGAKSGNLSVTSTRWNGSTFASHGNYTYNGFTFDSNEAYFGFTDLYAADTTFDNISITGELVPEPSHLALIVVSCSCLLLRRRR